MAPRGVSFCMRWFRIPHLPHLGVWGVGRPARKLLGNFGRTLQDMADSRTGWPNFSAPSRSVAFLGILRCLFVCGVFASPPFGRWRRGCQAPKFSGGFGRIRQNTADSRAGWPNFSFPSRSVAFRGAQRCVFLSSVVSHFPSSPFGCLGRGCPAPKLLGNFG